DEEVASAVEVDELEVAEAHGRDHAEHGAVHAADNGTRDGREQRAELPDGAEHEHDDGACFDDGAAADSGEADGTDVLAIARGAIASAEDARDEAADTLHADAAVDGLLVGSRCTGEPRTGVVVANRLDHRGEVTGEHADETREERAHFDAGDTPLERVRDANPGCCADS